MSRKHPNAYATFQRGKGLVGFLAGLVLATMIIIAVLLMLNSNSKTSIREPALTQPQQPEALVPNGASNVNAMGNTMTSTSEPTTLPPLDTTVASQAVTPVESASPVHIAEAEQPIEPDTQPKEVVQPIDDPTVNDIKPIEHHEDPIVNQPQPAVTPMKPTTSTRPAVRGDGVPHNVVPKGDSTIKSNRPANTNNNNANSGKTNSGSLKRDDLNINGVDSPRKPATRVPPKPADNKPLTPARPVEPKVEPKKVEPKKVEQPKPVVKETPKTNPPKPNNQPTTKKPSEVKPTPQQILDAGNIEKARELARKQNSNTPAPAQAKRLTSSNNSNNSGSVVIQAGAYSSRGAAESQRARLALLGVQARVVEANVNGKPTYRVQTARMASSQASNTRSLLQRNGVSTLERSAD